MDRTEPIVVVAERETASVAAVATSALFYLIGAAAVVFTTCYAYHWGI